MVEKTLQEFNAAKSFFLVTLFTIENHVKIKEDANPYLSEYDNYFSDRTKRRETLAKECRQVTTFNFNDKEDGNNSRASGLRAMAQTHRLMKNWTRNGNIVLYARTNL